MVSVPAWPPKKAARSSAGAGPRAASASRSSEPPGRGESIASFTFGAHRRLRSKAEFERVYRHGWRVYQKLFQATACGNELGCARLGLSIAAKAVGNAVSRNRIRRQIREVFRHRQDLPGVDIVVSARPQARAAANIELRSDLEQLLTTVRERCNRSPHSS